MNSSSGKSIGRERESVIKTMEYVQIKNSDLRVSRLCMGGCPMGGYGWGKVREEDLIDAVHTALDCGITMFDTADTYGLGKSEEILGKALGNHRKEVVVADKFGVRIENGKTFYDNSAEWIRTALEGSLKRLGTDYIDLYQIHYRDNKTPLSEVIETLKDLKKEGKIRYCGLSNIHADDVAELKDYMGCFVSIQDEYSLACRKNEEDLLNLSEKMQLTPLTWGSLGQGILTGKYGRNCSFGKDDRRNRDVYVNFHGNKLLKNLDIVEEMRNVQRAIGDGVELSSIAIRFILDYIDGSIVLAGMKNPCQVKGNSKAMEWKLTKQQIAMLKKVSSNQMEEREAV